MIMTGPESSGKTSLTQALALRYEWPLVPEYARWYLSRKADPRYTLEEVLAMAEHQWRLERYLSHCHRQRDWLLCDTDLLVFEVWLEVVYGYCPDWIARAWREGEERHYVLCDIDVPWEADPLREAPAFAQRQMLFERYRQKLMDGPHPYCLVSGAVEQRMEKLAREWWVKAENFSSGD